MQRRLKSLTMSLTAWLQTAAMLCCAVLFSLGASAVVMTSGAIAAELSHAPQTARAYIIEPSDGDTVSPDFTVKFGLSGMGIAPAGVEKDNTGHHHLLIDTADLPSLTEPLPATDQIRHFGGGQTETQLSLSPGQHSLRLILGNYTHIPHDNPVISKPITITVQ